MRFLIVLCACLRLVLTGSAQSLSEYAKPHHSAPVTVSFPEDKTDPLATLHSGHPRLLATAEEFDRIAGAADDPLRAEVIKRIIATADRSYDAPLTTYKLTDKKGVIVHDLLLKEARLSLERIMLFSMAYRLTHQVRYANRAKAELLAVTRFRDWTPEVFLATSEMSLAVGIGYDWCYDALTPAERSTIRKGLVDKALSFIPLAMGGPLKQKDGDIKDIKLWWVISPHNWNQVCIGGLLAGALAVAEDEPELARLAIRGARTYLPISMASYSPDGAWPEGPGYWSFGTTYNVFALAVLKSALGTDYGLSTLNPDFPKTTLFRLHMQGAKDYIFNFADSGMPLTTPVTSAFGWLADRYQIGVAASMTRQDLSDHFAVTAPNDEDDRFFPLYALWLPPPQPSGQSAVPLDAHFRGDADVAVFHSAWDDPDSIDLCFKSGRNGGSHAHLDLGSFLLDADGVRWAASLGPESYEVPQFFGKKRYTYYRMNNYSQNAVTPGKELQSAQAFGPIVQFHPGGSAAFAVADLSQVYPAATHKMYRGIFLLDRARVLVEDQIGSLTAGTPVYWRMMTEAKISLAADGRTATLTQAGKVLRAELLSPANAGFSSHPATPPTARESQNEGYSVLEATVPPNSASADLQVAVLLTPVGPKWPKNLPKPELKALPLPASGDNEAL